jgi:hypothetical protein
MSIPLFYEARLSFIWVETFPDLLTGGTPTAPLIPLGTWSTFAPFFDGIKAPSLASAPLPPSGLALPWPPLNPRYQHHFWQFYLQLRDPNGVTSKLAWERLVPLRTKIPVSVQSPWPAPTSPTWQIIVDGLLYPHGIALVLMPRLQFESGVSLTSLVDYALDVRHTAALPVTLPNGSTNTLTLDALATVLLTYLRERALGPGATPGTTPFDPQTIVTVVRGDNVLDSLPVQDGSDFHRALEGFCMWSPTWVTDTLADTIKNANLLNGHGNPAGHVVYHRARSRAVWFPRDFTAKKKKFNNRLSCYHRNFTLVSLQTEMLAEMVTLYRSAPALGLTPSDDFKALAKNAATWLGYLYAAFKTANRSFTYNSAGPRAFIEENQLVQTINDARAEFKMTPLAYTAR